jgi:hypothetical protein
MCADQIGSTRDPSVPPALDFTHQLCHEAGPQEEQMTQIASNIVLIAATRPSHRPHVLLTARVIVSVLPAMDPIRKHQLKSLGRPE